MSNKNDKKKKFKGKKLKELNVVPFKTKSLKTKSRN